jgi:hypothetical protein
MKVIKTQMSPVLLGFDMSEFKSVEHKLNSEYEPQNL